MPHSTAFPENPSASSKKRKSTGKRLRFEVFKRDHFTCQYCGAQPPDVVLVPDHIDPVAGGGLTTIDNLITACEACNQGKADRPLGAVAIRPDADLLYLQTQQEIAELQRYQRSLAERDALTQEIVVQLQRLWCATSDLEWHPADHVLRQMLTRYSPGAVEQAVVVVSGKLADRYLSDYGDKWVAYMHGVARNYADDHDGE